MANTYTPTRANYYQKNKDTIKAKRRKTYQENITSERTSALVRHHNNKERNNKKSLDYYYKNSVELNKKRQKIRATN